MPLVRVITRLVRSLNSGLILNYKILNSARGSRAKVARAKHNCEELSFFAKKVGSDYSLDNRRLFCVYKQGFAALAAPAPAASAIPDDPNSSKLWVVLGSNQGPRSYQERALPLSQRPINEYFIIYFPTSQLDKLPDPDRDEIKFRPESEPAIYPVHAVISKDWTTGQADNSSKLAAEGGVW